MNGVYKSLKDKVQDTLQRGKSDPTPARAEKSAGPLALNGEMEKLERVVAESIARLSAAVKETEAKMSGEARQAQQAAAAIKERVGALEAKLKESEEAVRRKDSSRQQIEETLKAQVNELRNDSKKKDEALAARDKEIGDLKAGFDLKAKQISELESANEKLKQEAAGSAKRAQDSETVSGAKIAALEIRITEMEELARRKDSTIKELEQKLAGKTRDLDDLAKNRQELLAGRDALINDLKSQLKLLTKGIAEMSSFFKQAQAFAVVERQDLSSASRAAPANRKPEKPVNPPGAVTAGANLQEGAPATVQLNDVKVMAAVGEEKRVYVPANVTPAAPALADEKPLAVSSNSSGVQVEQPAARRSNLATKSSQESAAPGSTGAAVKAAALGPAPQTISAGLLERVSVELAEVCGVMTPLAMLIVREHVTALGESTENFPKSRFPELVNSLVREILDANLQIEFRKRLAQNAYTR